MHVIEHHVVSQNGDEQMAQESPDAGHGARVGIRSAGVLKLKEYVKSPKILVTCPVLIVSQSAS